MANATHCAAPTKREKSKLFMGLKIVSIKNKRIYLESKEEDDGLNNRSISFGKRALSNRHLG